jgi:tetratricopeptide (TPR) repeat protein
MEPNREQRWAALILLVLALALYGYSVTFEYVLDDHVVASENAFVKEGASGIWKILTTDSYRGYLGEQRDVLEGGRYRPLSIVTFALEHQFFGLNPHVSHFINVLLYALTAILLLKVSALLIPDTVGKPWYLSASFLAAALFVLHPIHSEGVANIKGRDEILTLVLSLTALYASVRNAAGDPKRWLLVSGLAFLGALLAKENALTYVAVVPLAVYFFTSSRLRVMIRATIPLAAATLLYVGIRHSVMGYLLDSGTQLTGLMNNPFLGATTAERYATISYTLGLYLKLLFFPHPLTHDYYPYHIPIVSWADLRAWWPVLAYALLTGYALLRFRRGNVVSFAVLYFVATASIVSNLVVPIGTFMNERFMFMPSVGLVMCLGFLFSNASSELRVGKGRFGRHAALLMLGVICIAYAARTVTRVPAWRDAMSLNRAAVEVSTGSARANCFMAVALYDEANTITGDRARQLGLYREAETYADRSLAIHPTYPAALGIKAGVLVGLFQHDRDLDRLLNGFYALLEVRDVPFVDRSLRYLNRRRRSVARLTAFYHEVGFDLFAEQREDYDLAQRYLNYGLQLDPQNAQLLLDLARVHLARRDFRSALEAAETGLSSHPGHAELRRSAEAARSGAER